MNTVNKKESKRKFLEIAISMVILVVTASLTVSSYGQTSFTLDFGDDTFDTNPDPGGQPNFNNDPPYTMYFDDVVDLGGGNFLDATLVAEGPWGAFKSTFGGTTVPPGNELQWPHGSVNGDIRVFADQNQTINLTLYLWEADTGYTTPYDPGEDYEWTLVFYDIDSSPLDNYFNWDEVTLWTPGSYTVTDTTALTITPVVGGVNFSGDGVGGVPGQVGLESLTAQQADVAVSYTVMNTNSVSFSYIVGYSDNPPDVSLRGRNFLIDGGQLTLEGDPVVFGPAISIEKSTNGQDADEPTGPILTEGDAVIWEYEVTNTGDVSLSNIIVTDDQGIVPIYVSGDDGDDILQPQETWIYQAESLAVVGQYSNIGTATGAPPVGDDVSDSDPSHYFAEAADAPAIDIEKSTNGQDADVPTGPILNEGDPVLWEYQVTNTGNVPLINIIVTDDQGVVPLYVSGDDGDDILQPQETWIYRANSIAVIGQYSNIGTATGTPPEGDDVSDSDPSHYLGQVVAAPSIDIEKSTNGEDADESTGPELIVGNLVTWEYVVANTGNVALSNVIVTDNQAGVNPAFDFEIAGNGDGSFDPGEIWLFKATGLAVVGQYANIGTATGTSPSGTEVSDSDPSHYLGLYWAFTPGFWKNNTKDKGRNSHDAWKYTGYTTDVLLGEVFDPDCLDDYELKRKGFDEYTLLQALNFKGGDDLEGAMQILLRAAVASLLNASFHEEMATPDGVYPYTVDEVIDLVNEAICSGDRDTMLDLYEQLDWINNGVHYIEW